MGLGDRGRRDDMRCLMDGVERLVEVIEMRVDGYRCVGCLCRCADVFTWMISKERKRAEETERSAR